MPIGGPINPFSKDFKERFREVEDEALQFAALKEDIISIISRPWDEDKRTGSQLIRAVVIDNDGSEFANRRRYVCRDAIWDNSHKKWISDASGLVYPNCYNAVEMSNTTTHVGGVEVGDLPGGTVTMLPVQEDSPVWLRHVATQGTIDIYEFYFPIQFRVECN